MVMRVLLDTHVVLWALTDPDRLSAPVRECLEDPSTALFVSAVSAWEIATKVRLGKLVGAELIISGYRAHLVTLRVEELAITSAHALAAGSLDVDHRDPFDRMLAAQAQIEGLTLVTSDDIFAIYEGVATLW